MRKRESIEDHNYKSLVSKPQNQPPNPHITPSHFPNPSSKQHLEKTTKPPFNPTPATDSSTRPLTQAMKTHTRVKGRRKKTSQPASKA